MNLRQAYEQSNWTKQTPFVFMDDCPGFELPAPALRSIIHRDVSAPTFSSSECKTDERKDLRPGLSEIKPLSDTMNGGGG